MVSRILNTVTFRMDFCGKFWTSLLWSRPLFSGASIHNWNHQYTKLHAAKQQNWIGQPYTYMVSGSGKVSLSASQIFSTVVVTSHRSCIFLYLFPSANISPVRFILHLPDWWCIWKRETSFPVKKVWLIYLPPSLWPLTMKNRYAC